MILLLLFICKDKLSGSYCLVAIFESPVFHICSLYYWRRQWHPIPVLLPGKCCGRRSLAGFSPWGCWELDTTEWLHFHALEKEMATHSSVLSWRIPGTGESGGLSSMGSHRVGHDWSDSGSSSSRFVLQTYCTLTLGELQSKPVKQIFPYTNIVDYFCQVWNK